MHYVIPDYTFNEEDKVTKDMDPDRNWPGCFVPSVRKGCLCAISAKAWMQ